MVLKKFFFVILSFIFLSNIIAEDNYWTKIVKTAFENNPEVTKIQNRYLSTYINKKQIDYSWIPYFQFNFQQSLNNSRGDYIYVFNQYPNIEKTWIFTPELNISFNQKLPGNGMLSISSGYGFNYLADRNAFLQIPQIQLNFSQNLGRGAFGITKNPETLLMKEQLSYSELILLKEMYNQLQELFNLFMQFDIICAKKEYYSALVYQYETELLTAENKKRQGLNSNLETYFIQHQKTNAKKSLTDVSTEKNKIQNKILLLVYNFNENNFINNKSLLMTSIDYFFSKLSNDSFIYDNIEILLYESIQKQQNFNYHNNNNNFVPNLYISSILTTDSNINSTYGDWYKSFRNLTEHPSPIIFNTSIGINIKFETFKAKKLRKELYFLERKATIHELEKYKENLSVEIDLLQKKLIEDTKYLQNLELEIKSEIEFRNDRKELFKQNIITQNEYAQGETLFYIIFENYVSTFWEVISTKLQLIYFSDQNKNLLNHFLGDLLYETF